MGMLMAQLQLLECLADIQVEVVLQVVVALMVLVVELGIQIPEELDLLAMVDRVLLVVN